MNLSHTAAGRARRVDGDVFFPAKVRRTTHSGPPTLLSSAPYAWKRTLEDRIWSAEGPSTVHARAVLVTLVRHADATGRTWIGLSTIAAKAGIGSLRTVRSALDLLAKTGWLQVLPQTWASLAAEQSAAGRPVPRRIDAGQAPNLYVILDGKQPSFTKGAEASRPGLARISTKVDMTPGQVRQGGTGQTDQGPPVADLHCDLDPKGSGSRMESDEGIEQSTHTSSKMFQQEEWVGAWEILASAHADRTKKTFGLGPAKPDLRPEHRQLMAECLIEATTEVSDKLRQRSTIQRDVKDLQRDLAERVMRQYFKHDSEHLKRVKWALRDLPREIHARMVEAMQQLLRDTVDEPAKRRPSVQKELPEPRIEQWQPQVNALQAQRIIEALEASPGYEAYSSGTNERAVMPLRRTRPALSEGFVAELVKDGSNV